MTKHVLLTALSFIMTSSFAWAQCEYNSQLAVDMGVGSTTDKAVEILIQEDGKMIGVGSTYYIGSNSFEASLFRLNLDNTFDQTFGMNGRIGHTWEQRNTANCAILSESENIYIGGYQAPSNGLSGFRGYVAKILNDGAPDTSFAASGSFKFNVISGMRSHFIGVKEETEGQPLNEEKILAAFVSSQPTGFGLVRLTSEGILDTSFSTNGYVHHGMTDLAWQVNYSEAHFQSNGGVIVVGKFLNSSIVYPFVARMNENGAMDSEFGELGILRLTDEVPYNFADVSATLDAEDNILITYSTSGSPRQYVVTKVNGVTGQVDINFGDVGSCTATASGSFHDVWDVIEEPSTGIIYCLGQGSSSNRFPTIWTVDAQGNEYDLCGDGATLINQLEQGQGYHAGRFDANGDLRILGETGLTDTTSGSSQSFNMMIPTISIPSSIQELDVLTIDLYPNPAVGHLTIPLATENPLNYMIFDKRGRLLREGTTRGQIDVRGLENGYYYLTVVTREGEIGRGTFVKE